jgi:hypothetical protein
MHQKLSISQRMQPLSQVSERERGEREFYKGVWTFQSAKRASPTPGMEYIYSLFPLLAVMGKTRTSRTVRVWIPTVKTRSQRLAELAVGLADRPPGPCGPSAWAPRTDRLGSADCPRAGRGPSARSIELHPVLLRITDRLPGVRGLSAWKRIFSKTFAKKLRY